MARRKGNGWGTPVTTTPKGGRKKSSGGSSWGTPIDGSATTAAPQPKRDPTTELVRKLAQLQQLKNQQVGTGSVAEMQRNQQASAIYEQIRQGVKGYKGKDIQALGKAAQIDPALTNEVANYANDQGSSIVEPATLLGKTFDYASRPYQGVMSGIAEWSKQAEQNAGKGGFRLIPTDLGEIAKSVGYGLSGDERSSPTQIMEQAGQIREKQGVGTKAFGVLPGTNIKKGEPLPYLGKPGGVAVDVAASIPADPLSWVTFGLSAEGRAGMRAAEQVLGPERALDVAKGGVKVLDAEEKARLGANTVKLLKNTGGIGVRVPQPLQALRNGEPLLGPSRTVLRTRGVTEPLGRAAAATAHAAEGLPVVGAPVRGVKNTFRSLERTFVPRAAILQAERDGRLPKGTAVALDESRVRAMGATHLSEADLNLLAQGRKAAGLSEQENTRLFTALENGDKSGLDQRLAGAYDYLDNYRATLAGEKRRVGLIGPEGSAPAGETPILDQNYMPHVAASPEAADQLAADQRALAFSGPPTDVTKGPGGYTKVRGNRDTVESINASRADQHGGGKMFENDPFVALAKHGVEARRDVATRDFLAGAQQLKDAEGNPLLRNIDELNLPTDRLGKPQIPENMAEVKVPGHGTYVVDKALAPEITKVTGLMSNDAHLNAFLSGLDKWMALWKGYATVPLPFGAGFHMRNATSNVMLNWLADISPTDPAYAQALGIQRKLEKGFREGEPYKYLSGKSRDIAEQALNHDILKSGFLVGNQDVPRDLMRGFEGTGTRAKNALDPLNPDNALIRGGRTVGSGIEENARLAHFISKLRTLHDPEAAAASVRKYLFDYNDLTAVEQNVFKRVMPFYTFTRKNTPLWISAAFKQPGKFARIAQWQQAFEGANQMPGPVPSYMGDNGLTINTGVGGNKPWILTPDTPWGAAFSKVAEPASQLAGLTPGGASEGLNTLFQNAGGGAPGFAKALYDAYVQKRDPFSGSPIQGSEDQRLFVANQTFPILPKVLGLLNDKKRPARALSMFTGLQGRPYDQTLKDATAWEKLDALIAYLAALRKAGVKVPNLPGVNPNSKKSKTPTFTSGTSKARGW